MKRSYRYRSSITGRFVSAAFAAANPDTTYRVEVKRKSAGQPGGA
jgi:hypothetical protein